MNLQIQQYLSSIPRNKVVLSDTMLPDFHYIDLGKVMCENLIKHQKNPHLGLLAEEVLDKIFRNEIREYDGYGKVIAITNIGILFEEDLKFNVRSLIEQKSRDCLLIIHCDGEMDADRLYFLSRKDCISVDLSGLSYIIMKTKK